MYIFGIAHNIDICAARQIYKAIKVQKRVLFLFNARKS